MNKFSTLNEKFKTQDHSKDPRMKQWCDAVNSKISSMQRAILTNSYYDFFDIVEEDFSHKKDKNKKYVSNLLSSYPGSNKLFVEQSHKFNIARSMGITRTVNRIPSTDRDFSHKLYRFVEDEIILMALGNKEMPTKEEIVCSIITGIGKYFCWWTPAIDNKRSLNVDVADISNFVRNIFDKDIIEIQRRREEIIQMGNDFVDRVNCRKQEKISFCHKKPMCVEDLTMLFSECMSTADQVAAIMDYWCCSKMQAYRYMDKFGIERRHNTKAVSATTEPKENKEYIMNLENENAELKSQLEALRKDNERLKEQLKSKDCQDQPTLGNIAQIPEIDIQNLTNRFEGFKMTYSAPVMEM